MSFRARSAAARRAAARSARNLCWRSIVFLSFLSSVAFADASSVADQWVRERIPYISERLCYEKARGSVFDFYLKSYNELWAFAKELRALRADALSVEEELIEKSFHLKKDERNEEARVLSILEAQKQILKSIEKGDIALQKIDYLIDRFKELSDRFSEQYQNDLLTRHRVELHPDGVLEDVSDWDGLYFSASNDTVETIIGFVTGSLHAAKNYRKNRKINRKLQTVRDEFYRLQTSQTAFLKMVDSEFLNKKEEFEKGIRDIGEAATEAGQRLSKIMMGALNRFAALDHARVSLLQKFRSKETENKLAELKKELQRLEIERFEAALRARRDVVEFEKILEEGKGEKK